MTTKEISNKQERLVSSYLGWGTVPASGARDFNPGDISSDDWLGECKTHTKQVDVIEFNLSVFNKISTEGMSKFKKPVLIVDNGTQSIDSTYVIVSDKHVPELMLDIIRNGPVLTKYKSGSKSFNIRIKFVELSGFIHVVPWSTLGNFVIMPLVEFKKLLDGDYYE